MRTIIRTLCILTLVWVSACSNSEDSYLVLTERWNSNSNVGFYMTDAPPAGSTYQSVNVTVTEVDINSSSGDTGWKEVPLSPPLPINLLQFQNKANQFLIDSQLTAGTYQQLRLILSSTASANNVVVSNNGKDTTYDLSIPSGFQTGIKINLKSFTVEPDKKYAIIFDFDADASLHVTGNGSYKLQPVMTVKIGEIGTDGKVKTTDYGTN